MTFRLHFTSSAPPPPAPVIRTVRRYGDPFMVAKMGLDTAFLGTGNFQNVVLATWRNNVLTFSAVSQFQMMDTQALDYLRSIQVADAVEVNRKLNWLGVNGGGGRPYLTKNSGIAYGTMVWGGTQVQLETDAQGNVKEWTFRGRYQQEENVPAHDITFVKPVFFRRADIGRPVAELRAECKIVRATEAMRQPAENTFNDTPQGGVIWCPLWSPVDWPVNNGQTELFLAKEFLE